MIHGTRLRVASNPTRGWQANKRHTCVWLVVLGLCPKLKNHPLSGWMFIVRHSFAYLPLSPQYLANMIALVRPYYCGCAFLLSEKGIFCFVGTAPLSGKAHWPHCRGPPVSLDFEVTEEVYAAYMKSDRKIRYFEKDLKTERFLLDESGQLRQVIPSREDSPDRLMEDNAEQFADQHESVEVQVFRKISIEQLYEALQRLTDTGQSLIYALFFEGHTER